MRSFGPQIVTLAAFVAALLLVPFLGDEGTMALLFEVFLMLAMATLWNLMAGYVGLVSMGLQAYIGLGAYTVFFLSNTLGISPYWVLPAAPIVAGAVAAVTALFLLRLRDAYFSISTWVLAEVVAMLVFIAPGLGNITGMTLVASRDIDFDGALRVNFWLSGLLAAGAVAGIFVLMNSRFGLGMTSVRDNELAATSIGVDVWWNRFVAVVLAAGICGLAGAISFTGAMFVTVSSAFDMNWVVAMIFIVIVGGIGTIEGPIVGTVIYYGLRQLFTVAIGLAGSWYLVAMGVVAVATILLAPKGLWPTARDRFGLRWLSVRRHLPTERMISAKDLI